MIESWLDLARRTESHAMAAVVSIRGGEDPVEASAEAVATYTLVGASRSANGDMPWPFDPVRVADNRLRQLVEDLGRESRGMILLLARVAKTGEPRDFEDVLIRSADKCDGLRAEILTAMTAKGW